VVDLPLTLWAMVVCAFFFSSSLFWFTQGGSTQEASLGEWLAFRVIVGVLWPVF
jgi:hypothetical protein